VHSSDIYLSVYSPVALAPNIALGVGGGLFDQLLVMDLNCALREWW
jgi:hypothetical protein